MGSLKKLCVQEQVRDSKGKKLDAFIAGMYPRKRDEYLVDYRRQVVRKNFFFCYFNGLEWGRNQPRIRYSPECGGAERFTGRCLCPEHFHFTRCYPEHFHFTRCRCQCQDRFRLSRYCQFGRRKHRIAQIVAGRVPRCDGRRRRRSRFSNQRLLGWN